ncbi:MAG: S8 family serine peptidase [Steroidobacteraceae bacterium]|nr:S8 family serine peptidase [Steroidobacteraceae bacterium]
MGRTRSTAAARGLALLAGLATTLLAGTVAARPLPPERAALALEQPLTARLARHARIDPALAVATGRQRVLLRLSSPSLAEGAPSREAVRTAQAAAIRPILVAAPGARVTGAVQLALNAVFLEVDAKHLPALARDVRVASLSRVVDYERALADSVPYVGARTVQQLGYTGRGVRVAVIDSGLDYTHRAFGGPGTVEAWRAAYGTGPTDVRTTRRDGLFPTAKVVAGWDFVGEAWTGGPNSPARSADEDPIAAPGVETQGYCPSTTPARTCDGGHGTHVADILGGRNGVAPDVELVAIKACSAYSKACDGEALMLAFDFALDPNGDGDTSDRVDIVNLSLGDPYGQAFDDDLSAAVDGATRLGVLTVAASGNSGDKPFVTNAPGSAATALSVGQTAMPRETVALMRIHRGSPPNRGAIPQPWAPRLRERIRERVYYPASNPLGCTPFSSAERAAIRRRIVLVDRGECPVSVKAANLSAAGARIALIGFVDRTAPFAFSSGGGTVTIPTYAISRADADEIRGGATVMFAPSRTLPVVATVAPASSRGPGFEDAVPKPDLVAPGASVSAYSGTGNRSGPFAGTSGSAPLVAGAAALLKEARPGLGPLQIKQLLVNAANPQLWAASLAGSLLPDAIAPVSRIGGGELDVARALVAPVRIWDEAAPGGGALGFGLVDAWQEETALRRRVAIENLGTSALTFDVSAIATERGTADYLRRAAVRLEVPPTVTVPPRSTVTIPVELRIHARWLGDNAMNAGRFGDEPARLTAMEYDGRLEFRTRDGARWHLPWHVLPRRAANVTPSRTALEFAADGTATVELRNAGLGTAQYAAYSLLGTGPERPRGERGRQSPGPSLRAVGVTSFATSDCSAGFAMEFGVANWRRYALPTAVTNVVYVDVDPASADGPDYAVYHRDFSQDALTDGRQVVWAEDLGTGIANARFFATHPTHAANVALLVCGEQLGLGPDAPGRQRLRITAEAQDFAFKGPGTILGPWDVVPFGERYAIAGDDTPGLATGRLRVTRSPQPFANAGDRGVLLFTNAPRDPQTNNGAATAESEVLVLEDAAKRE